MSESVREQIVGVIHEHMFSDNEWYVADALLPLVEQLTAEARDHGRAEVMAAVLPLVAKWQRDRASFRIHPLGSAVSAVERCENELLAAIPDRHALTRAKAEAWAKGYVTGDLDAGYFAMSDEGNPYLTGDADE